MKLRERSENFYIITDDDTQIQLGDWVYDTNEDWQEGSRIIEQANHTLYLDPRCGYEKITHSTKPIENLNGSLGWKDIDILLLSEVKELFGLVDVEKKAEKWHNSVDSTYPDIWNRRKESYKAAFESGYNQALEDNKERKYTERDMIETYLRGATDCHNKCIERNWKGVELNVNTDLLNELAIKHIKSIQPKKEWEVEFSNGKLKLK